MEKTIETPLPIPATQKKSQRFLKHAKKEVPFAIGSAPFIWQIIFLYLPLLFLFTTCFLKITPLGAITGITFEHFTPLFDLVFLKIISNSLCLSFITTAFCLTIGFPLAYGIAFHCGRFKSLMIFLLIIPFWTNFILHIFAWSFILENQGLINTLLLRMHVIDTPIAFLNTKFATYLMSIYYYLPFMVLPLYSSMERFDKSLLEASLDLGASKRQTRYRILVPLTMSAIRVGVLLVFIPSFGEFIIPEFMGGDRHVFVGNAISQYVLGQNTASLGIAFTVISILCLLPAVYLVDKLLTITVKKLSREEL